MKSAPIVRQLKRELAQAELILNQALDPAWPRCAVGERVRIAADVRQQPGLADDVFTITQVTGTGASAMATVRAASGKSYKWVRGSDLRPPVSAQTSRTQEENTHMTTDKTASPLLTLTRERMALHPAMHFNDTLKQITREHPELALAHEEGETLPAAPVTATAATVPDVTTTPDAALALKVTAIAADRNVSPARALSLAVTEFPELFSAYQEHMAIGIGVR